MPIFYEFFKKVSEYRNDKRKKLSDALIVAVIPINCAA